ncbi:hypothetical protein B6U80_02195 [Candidatus Pacearchaeota archaeon ex4484_26]|nr:MAG: hypothetical protein B6U80_02195 [Candidatus Pacearchaeota archaeon ex4484_26]
MKINELKPNQSRINLEADVVNVSEVKSFLRFGRAIRVANATIKDDTGETKLTLWNDEVDKVKPGNKVRITNGYAKEFQGELTVTAGKFGKIEVLGEGESVEGAESGEGESGEGAEETATEAGIETEATEEQEAEEPAKVEAEEQEVEEPVSQEESEE